MGVKCIRTQRLIVEEEPVFLYQNMIMIKKNSNPKLEYDFMEKIGRGSFSQVYKAKHKHTQNLRAIKQIQRKNNNKLQKLIMNEFNILRKLDHPNIMKMYEYFQDDHFIYIAAELCPGKEFFDYIVQNKYLKQDKARSIFYDLVCAVRYMHDNGFMHRDLKPQNVLYDADSGSVKVVDLGSALEFQNSDICQRKRVGTSYYIAPEVLARNYNQKCDVWSLGVILYIMLSGEPPFKGKDDAQILDRVRNGTVQFKKSVWSSVSQSAKDLITSMIERNIKKRLSIEAVLNHEWFNIFLQTKNNSIMSQQQQKSMMNCLNNMKIYKDMKGQSLQQGIITFIVNFVRNNEDAIALQQAFKTLDLNGDGVLSEEELTTGMMKFSGVSKREAGVIASAVFKKIDVNKSGSIDYSEFVLAATNFELTICEENLDLAFDYLDADNSGSITATELKQKLGINISEQTYQNLLAKFDANSDGVISRQEFKQMMRCMMQTM